MEVERKRQSKGGHRSAKRSHTAKSRIPMAHNNGFARSHHGNDLETTKGVEARAGAGSPAP